MRRAAVLALSVGVAVLLVPSVLHSQQLLFQRDLLDFFLPMKAAWARAIREGTIPWWDPWTEGGQPFFATLQSQVFYPPNLVFALRAPLAWSLSVFVALHLALAGCGAYALARELECRPIAAALSLLSFEAGGFLVSLVDLLNQACAQAWLPWIALFALRFARMGARRDLAAWSASCALCFLAGEPQYAALGGLASLALAAARCRSDRTGALRRALGGAAAAAALALAACAAQLVPLAQLAAASTRAHESFQEGGRHALEPTALLALVRAPHDAFGGPAGAYVESLHVGAIVLALAVVGALRRGALSRCLVLLALASVLLALGPNVPGLGAAQLAALPFLRYPVKFFCVAALAIPLLAATGAESLLARSRGGRLRRAAAIALVTLAGLDLVRAQHVLTPTLPAEPLLRPTPLIELLQREASPDGPRVHATPLTRERLERRAGRVLAGDLAGAMRERVELLEGALPMLFAVPATWGGSALPPARQQRLLDEADGPLDAARVRELRAGWLLDASPRELPLPRVDVDGGVARLYLLEPQARGPRRQWRGPNVAVGAPGDPPPSDWPGWREGPPGTWRFRPTGLAPMGALSIAAWLALLAMAWPRRLI